jgi:ATP-dependent RNA helicase RhlE
MTFKELRIIDPILEALKGEGYTQPTPIQQQAIPLLLRGKDLLGCAQTGTGKTAAFAIPILQHLYLDRRHDKTRRINALIITPTRELAIQINESFAAYGKFTGLRSAVIFGGVKQGAQTQLLRRGVDILVATPGRLLDLMNQGFISLKDVRYFVLDEADHMLDMGFIHDIKRVITKLPKERQSLFFSATMPPDIVLLSKDILGNPEKITIRPQQATADRVEQALYYVSKKDKPQLLLHLLKTESVDSVLIFSRTKYGADKIVKFLGRSDIRSAAIHGNKSQGARQKALGNFKSGDTSILVATDIAARGIDVDDLSHVINFDLPNIPETYVHRIGRTGRASASGIAISFCDGEERAFLKDIQKLIAQDIEVISEHPYVDENPVSQTQGAGKTRQSRSSNRPYRGNSRGGNRSYGNTNSNRGSRRPNSRSHGA